ncbi:MAG: type I-B CRISPR-associated endonuclease Cas1b [Nitrososphaerales archaeon]
MRKNYYLLKSGRLKRKENTLYLETSQEKIPLPVNNVAALFAFGELDLNSKLLVFLSQNKIPIHFFNYYGFYSGSYYPREYLNSGFLIVKQVENYLDKEKRLEIAKEIISSASYNIIKNLQYYKKHGKEVDEAIKGIEEERAAIDNVSNIPELMGLEGRIRDHYYQSFNNILRKGFEFEKRVKRPPDNTINCLISFGNSLLYTTILTEIYNTQLNPTISYLHEPSERRFSLSLDLSEIFKPVIVGRVIFKLINNRMVDEKHFLEELNFCYLNEKGKRVFISEYEDKLRTTIKHKTLERNTSYQRLIRLECYKLIKHLIGEQKYEGFKVWW